MAVSTADKRATFRKMHESGCFVLPNPYDVGSARALQHLGFKAVASTSAGFAWTIGKADNVARRSGGANTLEYHETDGLKWFTRWSLTTWVNPETNEYKGWGDVALKSGLIGSVYAACTPVSA